VRIGIRGLVRARRAGIAAILVEQDHNRATPLVHAFRDAHEGAGLMITPKDQAQADVAAATGAPALTQAQVPGPSKPTRA
jgi:hypothetical protein